MNCLYCRRPLKGFLDARIIAVNGSRVVACADLAGCDARKAQIEKDRIEGVQKAK
jgi:alpha-D-ribose 1-methylphosphonate 5-phosphate C-P lyase